MALPGVQFLYRVLQRKPRDSRAGGSVFGGNAVIHGTVSSYTNRGCRCLYCSEARREYKRRYDLRTRYGISPEEYDSLLDSQQGKCPICELPLRGTAQVDHDHESGRVRGLLCVTCNLGIGHSRDSPRTLRGAIPYLSLVN